MNGIDPSDGAPAVRLNNGVQLPRLGLGVFQVSDDEAESAIFVTTKLWNSDQGYERAPVAFAESLGRLGLQ